ncbi:MAG: dihydrofolate reductase [Enterocloster asparagiformis]|nr:dihydrofolate reductase [Enterocloster asparagiformis]
MERDVILYIGVSVDGYLADTSGGVGWMQGHGNEQGDGGYGEFLREVDTVIMGHATYRQVKTELSPDRWPYEGKECYVVSSQFLEDTDQVTFWPGDVWELVFLLKQRPGKAIWLVGGAKLLQSFMEQELVDQYWISTLPVILGKGMRLFLPGDYEERLILDRTMVWDGIVTNVYYNRAESEE